MAAKVQATQFYLPTGRIVMGDPHSIQENDQQGRKREHPTVFFAVAVPKTDPYVNGILGTINQVARTYYQNMPHIMDQINKGLIAENFAWKVDDGDSQKNAGREGFAGCWVFRFSTSIFPVKCGDSQNNPIDPTMIKCGYYVDVSASVAPNTLTDKNAGVYLNPNGVRLLGYGQEIQSGPTIGQMFKDKPAALPPGASAVPVATGNPLGAPAPMAPGAPSGMPGTAPAGAPASPPPGFANGMTPPPAATTAPPPPPPSVAAAAPPLTVEQIQAQSAQLAAQAGVQHYPGHRIKPDRSGYDPDPTPAPIAATPAPMTNGGAVAGALPPSSPDPMTGGVAAPGVPAGAQPGQAALGTPPLGSPTVSPTNPPAGVQPHPGFLQPPNQQSPDEVSAGIAAANRVQHYPGYRYDVGSNSYQPNPVA